MNNKKVKVIRGKVSEKALKKQMRCLRTELVITLQMCGLKNKEIEAMLTVDDDTLGGEPCLTKEQDEKLTELFCKYLALK